MKSLIALYFFILATLQLGLLLGIYHYYQSRHSNKPSHYWLGSLIANVLALYIFGVGVLGVEDVSKPEFNFTIANALFYVASISQVLFTRSLNLSISNRLKFFSSISIVIFIFIFEYLRRFGNFEQRTMFACSIGFVYLSWGIVEVAKKWRNTKSPQLLYFQIITFFEIVFITSRFLIVSSMAFPTINIEALPKVLIFLTISQLVMNTLSYICIGNYWAERVAIRNIEVVQENEFVKNLLIERENLVSSLLMANKSAATGALSASIAHELNQPLAAIQLNTQFLRLKLDTDKLDIASIREIALHIENDNKRIANIVSSLRNIFGKEALESKLSLINPVVESLMPILLPQTRDRGIQLIFNLNARQSIYLNESELKQVILNLVNNAIEALGEASRNDKTILIETEDVNDYVLIKIADNGPGISESLKSNLFDLMKSSKDKGMGLGLWLCKHIVERHQGKISAQNLPKGGAEFAVSIPLNLQ